MATKTITITSEAYEKLARLKERNESFSDVINRISGKSSILKLVGLLSNEEAKKIKKHIEDTRKKAEEEMEEKIKRLL